MYPPPPPDPQRTRFIAVLGGTGSGKSTFINLASGSDKMRTASSLASCTQDVAESMAFSIGGQKVVLIDTPGFDDNDRGDTEILHTIAAFLDQSYQKGILLTGIIYMHRISDFRMGGVAVRNFRIFHKICGTSSLKNVSIVTNMWGSVPQDLAEFRERELSDKFFKPVLDGGAHFLRHTNTHESACAILQNMVENTPEPVQLQRELIDEGKSIGETEAGAELRRDLSKLEKKYQREIDDLAKELKDVRDGKTKLDIQGDIGRAREELKRIKNAMAEMSSDYERAWSKVGNVVDVLVPLALGIAVAALVRVAVSHSRSTHL